MMALHHTAGGKTNYCFKARNIIARYVLTFLQYYMKKLHITEFSPIYQNCTRAILHVIVVLLIRKLFILINNDFFLNIWLEKLLCTFKSHLLNSFFFAPQNLFKYFYLYFYVIKTRWHLITCSILHNNAISRAGKKKYSRIN